MSGDVASQVLDLVRAASPAAQAEVAVDSVDFALTRFANSVIHQNVAEATRTVRLRLHADGRTATGTTTVTDTDGLAALVERTVAAARLCPPDPQWPGLAEPGEVPAGPEVDEATAYADPAARAERVRAFVTAADGLETAGYCSTARLSMAFANSAGQTASSVTAQAAIDAIARHGLSDGVTRLAATRLAELDGAVLGARAAAKARAGLEPVELPPGRYEVVLEPTAVLDLIELLATYGFNGKVAMERRSFVEVGESQFDSAISLVDDPYASGGAGLGIDIEGTAKRRLTLVDAGTSAALTHDRRTAAQAGAASTGHALAGSPYGPVACNLVLLPGAPSNGSPSNGAPSNGAPTEVDGPAADSAVAALVAQVSRGLLVTDNWYTRVLDPRTLVVTGLTRNGVWLIEDGQVMAPVQNMRFTQSYPAALAPGAVLGVGTHAQAVPSNWDITTYRTPALRLASWNYTGNASG